MHRLLLRCFLCSSSSTTPTAGAGFIRELATLVAACHFHTSVGLAKSLLLYSQPPATSVPDLYHTLVSTAAASQVDPHPPSFLSNAASALIVASALLALPDGALWLLSLLADAHANLPSLSSYNLLREFLLSLDRHADVGRAFDLLNAPGARPDTFTWNKAIQVCVVLGDVDKAVLMLHRMDCEGHSAPAPTPSHTMWSSLDCGEQEGVVMLSTCLMKWQRGLCCQVISRTIR
uniref:Pentatricopeptide repeat-containing protein n=1 Tax=Aegilops tauschii subsp. strangulata TaxID=200361 RepID=A0A453RUU6_AEGTS